MVKFTLVSTFLLLTTLSSLAFASPLQPRDINKFVNDLLRLSSDISRFASAVNSVGNTITVIEAMAINNSARQVKADLDQCNSDVKGIHPISYTDAEDVLSITKAFTPVVVETLNRFGEKKSVVEQYPFIIPLIEKELVALHDSAMELANAIVALELSSLKEDAKNIKNEINAAFNKAISIYSY